MFWHNLISDFEKDLIYSLVTTNLIKLKYKLSFGNKQIMWLFQPNLKGPRVFTSGKTTGSGTLAAGTGDVDLAGHASGAAKTLDSIRLKNELCFPKILPHIYKLKLYLIQTGSKLWLIILEIIYPCIYPGLMRVVVFLVYYWYEKSWKGPQVFTCGQKLDFIGIKNWFGNK